VWFEGPNLHEVLPNLWRIHFRLNQETWLTDLPEGLLNPPRRYTIGPLAFDPWVGHAPVRADELTVLPAVAAVRLARGEVDAGGLRPRCRMCSTVFGLPELGSVVAAGFFCQSALSPLAIFW
jgi:hypothetical protein